MYLFVMNRTVKIPLLHRAIGALKDEKTAKDIVEKLLEVPGAVFPDLVARSFLHNPRHGFGPNCFLMTSHISFAYINLVLHDVLRKAVCDES